MSFFNIEKKNSKSINKVYPHGNPIPHYIPEGIKVDLTGCYNTTQYQELCKAINNTDLNESIKQFLRLGATRFIKFNYPQFAEYYCNCSDSEEKQIMEDLALVIIDDNNNIAKAYSKYKEYLDQVIEKDKQKREKEEI